MTDKTIGTFEINVLDAREQTQEDIITFIESYGFLSHPEFLKENLCQIVVDNFERLRVDDKPNDSVERYQALQDYFEDTEDLS